MRTLLYVFHVFTRITDESPCCSHTFVDVDWTHAASFASIEAARAAAFVELGRLSAKHDLMLGGQVQVRVYADCRLDDAAEHAAANPMDEAIEFHWRETGKAIAKVGNSLGGFEFHGKFFPAEFGKVELV